MTMDRKILIAVFFVIFLAIQPVITNRADSALAADAPEPVSAYKILHIMSYHS